MSIPLTADLMVKRLKAEGLKVVEYPGWRTHNRNHKGAWGPVHGIIIHHTAGADSFAGLKLVYDGRSDLPGPLAHAYLSKDGTVTLTGNGRANHAGLGDNDVLQAVYADAKVFPKPNQNNVDGNASFYGIEIANLGNGKDPYPAVQYDAAVKWAAAICRVHGWTAQSVIGHKEWTNQKIDPSFPMDRFRADVAKRLKRPTKVTPTPKPVESKAPTTSSKGTTSMPTPGGPYHLSLSDTNGQDLTGVGWVDVNWNVENEDEAGIHSTNDTHFGYYGWYSGVVYLKFSGVAADTEIQARLVEVDSGNNEVKSHPIGETLGTGGSTFYALPVAGKLASGRRLKVKISHFDPDDDVNLVSADLRLIWWISA